MEENRLREAIRAIETTVATELEGVVQQIQDRQEYVQLYIECAASLLSARKNENNPVCKLRIHNLAKKVIERAEAYKKSILSQNNSSILLSNPHNSATFFLNECYLISLDKALGFEKKQDYGLAHKWYIQASDLLFKLIKHDKANMEIYRDSLKQILACAEALPRVKQSTLSPSVVQIEEEKLSPQEIEVLKNTSSFNGKLFMPWPEDGLQQEKFTLDELFTDPDSFLTLCDEQMRHFSVWKRVSQLFSSPKIISMVSALSVTQSVITDCSFVASLCVAANYERRYNKPLITRIIFPQDKDGQPVYNQSGKYLVKLHFNGIPRKVVIDDFLPVTKKAYMKLNGGYQFPGSNSGIDLHALTGWIPEDVYIDDKLFNAEKIWKRLKDGHELGACLITVSTGQLTPANQEQLGLHTQHAYAVLDVREIGKHRLLQVKNPWTKKRWRGKFSPSDKQNWTRVLLDELDYDILGALEYDNGVFWMDYSSLCSYFAVIHMSWNPELFSKRQVVHARWDEKDRPLCGKDKYSFEHNPQYSLELKGQGSAWVLLSRHITKSKEQLVSNNQFLTLHAYPGGQRVYYRGGNQLQPLVEGVYSNNPLFRTCIVNDTLSNTSYTLIVSQHEQIQPVIYTLRIYSSVPCVLKKIARRQVNSQVIQSEWNAQNSGGSCNQTATYKLNPQYVVTVNGSGATVLTFKLETVSDKLQVNVMVCKGHERVMYATTQNVICSSGNYRTSFAVCNHTIPGGESERIYTVVCSTFTPGQTGAFTFSVESTHASITVQPLP